MKTCLYKNKYLVISLFSIPFATDFAFFIFFIFNRDYNFSSFRNIKRWHQNVLYIGNLSPRTFHAYLVFWATVFIDTNLSRTK